MSSDDERVDEHGERPAAPCRAAAARSRTASDLEERPRGRTRIRSNVPSRIICGNRSRWPITKSASANEIAESAYRNATSAGSSRRAGHVVEDDQHRDEVEERDQRRPDDASANESRYCSCDPDPRADEPHVEREAEISHPASPASACRRRTRAGRRGAARAAHEACSASTTATLPPTAYRGRRRSALHHRRERRRVAIVSSQSGKKASGMTSRRREVRRRSSSSTGPR